MWQGNIFYWSYPLLKILRFGIRILTDEHSVVAIVINLLFTFESILIKRLMSGTGLTKHECWNEDKEITNTTAVPRWVALTVNTKCANISHIFHHICLCLDIETFATKECSASCSPEDAFMAKRLIVTYALWAIGGPLGLHHLYLRRDSHALLWMLTLGGFWLGWLREFFRIPTYVNEANQEFNAVRGDSDIPPPVGLIRFAGQICVGIYFGSVALISLNSLSFFYLLVLPLSVGAGVHLVSCVGLQTTDLQKTLTTCLVTSPIFYGSRFSPLPISIAASVTAAQNRKFKAIRREGTALEPLG